MNILAIRCHPDDLEIGCGGTLAKYAGQGHQVIMCHVANGNMGHALIIPEELRDIRTRESADPYLKAYVWMCHWRKHCMCKSW